MAPPVLGVIGQAVPAAAALTTLYTCPAARRFVSSTLAVAETNGAAVKIRIHVCKAGAAAATSNAIVYDASLAANSQAAFTLGLTLAATDLIRVQSDTGNATFTLFGEETDVPAS